MTVRSSPSGPSVPGSMTLVSQVNARNAQAPIDGYLFFDVPLKAGKSYYVTMFAVLQGAPATKPAWNSCAIQLQHSGGTFPVGAPLAVLAVNTALDGGGSSVPFTLAWVGTFVAESDAPGFTIQFPTQVSGNYFVLMNGAVNGNRCCVFEMET